jgi:hypothetical protein
VGRLGRQGEGILTAVGAINGPEIPWVFH